MIIIDKIRSKSFMTSDELQEAIMGAVSQLSPEEMVMLEMAANDIELEASLSSFEYERVPVSMVQFLEDEYFLGNVTKSLYGAWKQDLIEMFESGKYSVAAILGSIGSGKSFYSHFAVIRMLYEASCLRDPAAAYGLSAGSRLSFFNLATSRETARRVVFEGIMSKIHESPYFKYEFPPLKDLKNEVHFPKGLTLLAGSSNDNSIIGTNAFGGIIDEANFFIKAGANSSAAKQFASWGEDARVGRLYESVRRRMKSRFLKKGKLPGILLVTSSKGTKDSFTERMIRKAQQDGDDSIFVRDRSILDVKADSFSDEKFNVLVGDDHHRSRILLPHEDPKSFGDDAVVIEVPEDLRQDFEGDIDSALRDIAGIATVAIASFMGHVSKIDEIFDKTREHPFVCHAMDDSSEWDSRLPYRIEWHKIARQKDNGEWEPKLNPGMKRYVQLDPASTGDSFGLAIVHIAGQVPAGRAGAEIAEFMPVFVVDFLLRIRGEPGSEVLFKNVRQLLYQWSEHGFHLGKITTDTYQSREMVQALQEQGYIAEILSVDTSKEPYRFLRSTIYDGRVKSYDSPVLSHELKRLEETPLKIDHPAQGSKDLADSLCGAVWTAYQSGNWGAVMAPVKGVSDSQNENEPETDESFVPVETDERGFTMRVDNTKSPGVAVDALAPKVYVKKAPKTVAPTYKKVKAAGGEEDLTVSNETADIGIMRG